MPPNREKKTIVRVRSGCATCRVRKIKCDETKPKCLKCTSTGRTCDRYGGQAAGGNALQATRYYSIPFTIPGSQEDRQLLHYYCVHAVIDVAGFSLGSMDFWKDILLQRARHENVLQKSLVALASMHRDQVTNQRTDQASLSPTTLTAYNKAVRQLRKYLATSQSPNIDVVLITCAILYFFDCGRGEYGWAMKHGHNGLQILQRHGLNRVAPEIRSIFHRIDAQIVLVDVDRRPSFFLPSDETKLGLRSHLPESFRTLHEGQSAQEPLNTWLLDLFKRVKWKHTAEEMESYMQSAVREACILLAEFDKWRVIYDRLVESLNPNELDDTQRHSITLQNMWQCLSTAVLAEFLHDVPREPDALTTEQRWSSAVVDIEYLIAARKAQAGTISRSVCFELTMCTALYCVAAKCRYAHLRKRGLELLASLDRREGLVDSNMLGIALERMMQVTIDGSSFPMEADGIAIEEWGMESLVTGEEKKSYKHIVDTKQAEEYCKTATTETSFSVAHDTTTEEDEAEINVAL